MKTVILAGGMGTRLSEETDLRPKPMVEIGGKPLLWHIMKIYSTHGFNDFVICCGYKGYLIKEYFSHYYMHQADVSVDLERNEIVYHNPKAEPWRVAIVDTGLNTMTGGRVKRIEHIVNGETFMLTYGDGLADVDLPRLFDWHHRQGGLATLTAVQPSGRFGSLEIQESGAVMNFKEKPKGDGAWINGGFFVCEPGVFDYIREGDATVWETSVLPALAAEGKLNAYKHEGFWLPMDTLRDKRELEALWSGSAAPWKTWQ